jgi:hypothetical protein
MSTHEIEITAGDWSITLEVSLGYDAPEPSVGFYGGYFVKSWGLNYAERWDTEGMKVLESVPCRMSCEDRLRNERAVMHACDDAARKFAEDYDPEYDTSSRWY